MSVRITISLDDDLAARVRAVSGNRSGDYIARAVRAQLLADELRTLPEVTASEQQWHADAEQAGEVVFDQH